MSKSVELLAGSEDGEQIQVDNSRAEERSRLNLNGSRQLSKSATELRDNDIANSSPSRRGEQADSGVVHHHRHHRHGASVAQRTHTFFATLKSRWARSRSKERKKSKDAGNILNQEGTFKATGVESDYAADYSSEHSRSSSATQSPARHCLNHPESPLVRGGRQTVVTKGEDSPGKCSEGYSKSSLNYQPGKDLHDEARGSISQDDNAFLQEEVARKRELALRQHAFFQLRLHIRRGANLVAMDRCGASDPYVKVKCCGRLLHKSRTVHRDLNPIWDESVTLPIEDPFQPLTIKVFDYDWGLQDDFMGAAFLDLTQLDLGQPLDVTLELKDPARPKQHLGEIYLTVTLWPRNQQEKEQIKKPQMDKMEEDSKYTAITEENISTESINSTGKVSDIIRAESNVSTEIDRASPANISDDDIARNGCNDVLEPDVISVSSKSIERTQIDNLESTSNDNSNVFQDESVKIDQDDVTSEIGSHQSSSSSNADAIFQQAINEMQFNINSSDRNSPNIEGISSEKNNDKNNTIEHISSSLDTAPSIEAPPRRAKLQGFRQKDSKFAENLAADQNILRKRSDDENALSSDTPKDANDSQSECSATGSNFFANFKDDEKDVLEGKYRGDPSSRRWSSLENLRSKGEKISEVPSKMKTVDGPTVEKRIKEKRTIGSLKSSLERKMGSVERILEDRIERILGENVEKHPWLSPIESWIIDRCKSSGTYAVPQTHRGLPSENGESSSQEHAQKRTRRNESSFEFKFTAPDGEDKEAKIETKIIENSKRSRRAGSPKSERSCFDASCLKSRLKKNEHLQSQEESMIANESVLDVKDVKHHNYDLFDKLKDNVRGKMEDIHRYFQRTNRLADVNRRLKSQIWSSVVTIVLVEAKNLLPMDIDGLSDPYVKFRLGTEKYKSKVVNKTLNPVWLEQFDLHLYEDPYLGQELEVTVWDRDKSHQDDLMGRTMIDLATLERETTHRIWRDLEDGSGNIFLLLTISGTTASETISDLAVHEETPRERNRLYQRYSFMNTLQRIRDVGHLTVKVFRAQGLAAADLGGKSDPFCVLELVNSRLQTQTEYKTLAPSWQKIFTFNVKDINSVLEVTVYDEDRDHKVEFLGRVAIPLLRIRNGEKRWYALKDKKLRGRAKGSSAQILLEMTVVWNVFRACIRTLNPKEKKYMEPEIKFKRQVFLRNVLRLKAIIIIFIDIGKYVQSCWEWENKMRSIIALVFFIFSCCYFEPYMIPGVALLILMKYYLLNDDGSGFNQWISGQVAALTGAPLTHHTGSHLQDDGDDGPATPGDDDDDDDDKDKEEKKSLKERLQAIQEVTQTVQNSIGYIASLCERVKNLFNFTVPYLSYLAMILTILGAAVLYFIPLRYLILAWGVNKFFRKILRPHSVPNNELLDLISRVPDDEELLNYRELKSLPTADCEKPGTSGSPGSSNLTRREQRKRHKAA